MNNRGSIPGRIEAFSRLRALAARGGAERPALPEETGPLFTGMLGSFARQNGKWEGSNRVMHRLGSWKLIAAPCGHQAGRATGPTAAPGTTTRGKRASGGTGPAAAECVKRNPADSGRGEGETEHARPSAPAIRAADQGWGGRPRTVRRPSRGSGQPPDSWAARAIVRTETRLGAVARSLPGASFMA
jgi:hypothetical protein